ncbi:hypothetical protein SAMN05216436_10168 [bacterium A37T11]|nr:hypothetical protein SAMN05216436_10168 [bacterium A37T11]
MKIKYTLIAWLLPAMFMACSKDDDASPEPEGFLEGTNWVPARVKKLDDHVYLDEKFNVVYVVDLRMGTVTSGDENPSFYWNFDSNSEIDTEKAKEGSETWHVLFNYIYFSTINADASTPNNTEGNGKVRIVRTAFDDLYEAPESPMIRNNIPIEMDTEPATTDGWGLYHFSKHIMDYYPDRTIIFHLRDGRYVKFQMLSLYQGNPPVVNDKNEFPSPYLNCRYFIQQNADSRNLKTK